jgi:hypothetical protein
MMNNRNNKDKNPVKRFDKISIGWLLLNLSWLSQEVRF